MAAGLGSESGFALILALTFALTLPLTLDLVLTLDFASELAWT